MVVTVILVLREQAKRQRTMSLKFFHMKISPRLFARENGDRHQYKKYSSSHLFPAV